MTSRVDQIFGEQLAEQIIIAAGKQGLSPLTFVRQAVTKSLRPAPGNFGGGGRFDAVDHSGPQPDVKLPHLSDPSGPCHEARYPERNAKPGSRRGQVWNKPVGVLRHELGPLRQGGAGPVSGATLPTKKPEPDFDWVEGKKVDRLKLRLRFHVPPPAVVISQAYRSHGGRSEFNEVPAFVKRNRAMRLYVIEVCTALFALAWLIFLAAN